MQTGRHSSGAAIGRALAVGICCSCEMSFRGEPAWRRAPCPVPARSLRGLQQRRAGPQELLGIFARKLLVRAPVARSHAAIRIQRRKLVPAKWRYRVHASFSHCCRRDDGGFQAKAKPSAAPTTIAVKTSGSTMDRQLFRNVSSMGLSFFTRQACGAHPDGEDRGRSAARDRPQTRYETNGS